MDNCSLLLDNCTVGESEGLDPTEFWNISTSSPNEFNNKSSSGTCGEWVPGQRNLFQISNLCFAVAFLVPRKYKQGVILLRALLTVGFIIQAVWSGVHVCSPDIVAWSIILGLINFGHLVGLTLRLIPPALSPELLELYSRMFQPLKVSRKHYKELVKEGSILYLEAGDAYALEDVTNADERLSILLRGKLKVTCDSIHLHYISSFQFIDSPEWEAGHITSEELFQVTITAEEDCMYLSWPKLKLDRVLRHRPTVKVILSNLIGKDITQKLYWLNETMGVSGGLGGSLGANKECTGGYSKDTWRRLMPRSLSVDAVNTGAKGHVRSSVWKTQEAESREEDYLLDGSPSRAQKSGWTPVVASQFPERSPFLMTPALVSSMLTPPPPPFPSTPTRSSSRRGREVKFEESNV